LKRTEAHIINTRDKYGNKLPPKPNPFDTLRNTIDTIQEARRITQADIEREVRERLQGMSLYGLWTTEFLYEEMSEEAKALHRAKQDKRAELQNIYSVAVKKCTTPNNPRIWSSDPVYEKELIKTAIKEWKLRSTKLYNVMK
jgi:hypothetical protein